MIDRLVVLGAGDVTKRYLIPAMAQLARAGALPKNLEITAVGREEGDTDWFRERADAALDEVEDLDDRIRSDVVERLRYHHGDATDAGSLEPVIAGDRPVVVYLALPAAVFADAIEAVIDACPPAGSRIVIEKPFGTDSESAEALNESVHRGFAEADVFRIDHFLGMQTAHNITAVRFANRIIELAWCAPYVTNVEVVWDETLALEGRAGYYDGTGAARDMLQNHLLQLACLVAMEAPDGLDRDSVADRKVEVLRAIRPWDDDPVGNSSRARYTAGEVGGSSVPGYVDEDGVDPNTETETFAEMVVAVDTPRWNGVPFTLRSGKALATDRHEIVVHFASCEHRAFAADPSGGDTDELRLTVDPDQVVLGLQLAVGGGRGEIARRDLVHELAPAPCGPYALLFLEALSGGNAYSVRADEAEASWAAIEPFLEAWERGEVPMGEYAAGSNGPAR